jgi:hypothetical protein
MNRRSRALLSLLVRVPCCLALLPGLLLGAGRAAAVPAGAARTVPAPPGAGDRAGAVVVGQVTPPDELVAQDQNGDFVLTIANTGPQTARNVRVLLDDAAEGNGVGSPDGRCLGRLDASSPADLWCELGTLAPGQAVTVGVHAYMDTCVGYDPYSVLPQSPVPAFLWRIAYEDEGQARVQNEPVPYWSC